MRSRLAKSMMIQLALATLLLMPFQVNSNSLKELPERGIQDSELDLMMTSAARDWAQLWKWKQDVIYCYAIDLEWEIVKHPFTSELKGREITGVILTHDDNNHCEVHYGHFSQGYSNGEFIGLKMKSLLSRHDEINCDKL